MNRRHVLALSGALLAGTLAGCSAGGRQPGNDDPPGSSPTPGVTEDALAELVRETNGLAFDLYDELIAVTPEENLLASPVSICCTAGMAASITKFDAAAPSAAAGAWHPCVQSLHAGVTQACR